MRRFAVVGSPIAHSLSPLLHSTAYAALGLDDAEYGRHEVRAGELEAFLRSGPGRELEGLSVTMPGKPEAAALASERDELTALLGVANTLLRRPDGTWRAENHDVHGIAQALRDHGAREVHSLGVLGSGATAASAVAAAAELGAERVILSARSPEKLADARGVGERLDLSVTVLDWERSHEILSADCVVSALALAGAQAVAEAWAQHELPAPRGAVLDVLYAPSPPPLAALLRERGYETADGLEMLVHQADRQLRAMVGVDAAPTAAMLAVARERTG